MENRNHIKYIFKLWNKIEFIQKKEILKLIILNLILSLIEIINVATIIPIISIMMKGENYFYENETIRNLIINYSVIKEFLSINNLIYLFILSNSLVFILKIAIIKMQNTTAYEIGKNINNEIYNKLMNLNYLEYKSINSSEHISMIATKSQSIIINTIQPLINMIGLSIISIFLICIMLKINIEFSIVIIFISIFSYGIIVLITKNIINKNSIIIDEKNTELVKIINESFGSIKDVIINKHKNYFIKKYNSINNKLKNSQSQVNMVGNLPRPFIEYILILTIIIYLLWSFRYGGSEIEEVTGIIAVIYSVQRLIPLMQQFYYNYNSVKASKSTLITVIESIESKKIINKIKINNEVKYNQSIKFENIHFKYPETEKWILKNFNCEINKGETIGLTGKSGAGKTTFIDLLMGLMQPTIGKIYIDNVELTNDNNFLWHECISHVPQKIYLSDDTIINNIAFGIDEKCIDTNRINKSIIISHLNDINHQFENMLHTHVGERADKISGGQIQRIALARAFYKDFEIIILDEATNALDKITENNILKSIKHEYPDKTLIIITHNKELLFHCNKIINIDN
jgi:ATP-binding cassette subfamily B protein